MVIYVIIASVALLLAGYLAYSKIVAGYLRLDNGRVTPAREINDGVDYVPAGPGLLIGQHFSAIAAAGPIVGPILAGIWFGWLPALLWIIFGTIFIGGVHDMASLFASVRHKASSIAELARRYMSRRGQALFLVFIWFALVYVIIAFTDITAQTFKTVSSGEAFGPGVAVSSVFYIIIGLVMGVALRKFNMSLKLATVVFIPLVVAVIWLGASLPDRAADVIAGIPVRMWGVILLVYCFIASLIPMWLLLQPRGYLGGWFLYITMIVALGGALFSGARIQYPAVNLEGFRSLENSALLFPVLFITIACGACSGFHGIVSSGTTSKQIDKESDTRVIGYGAMALEGLVAVLALVTVMILPRGSAALKGDPNFIYARGLAGYMGMAGIDFNLALSFTLLAFSTFVYDTLDVCTRLARYVIQELFGWKSRAGAAAAAFVSLSVPFLFLFFSKEKAYLTAWPVFGVSNQLLASLTLLVVSVWLIRTGRKAWFTVIPMVFMMVVTLTALTTQIVGFLKDLTDGGGLDPQAMISGGCGIVLFFLSIWLVIEAAGAVRQAVVSAEA